MSLINKFIGIPFKDGGRDFNGCDCWGLAKLYYKEILNYELPEYGIQALDFAKISEKMNSERVSERWIILDKPVNNCIALLRLGNSKDINHAAIYLEDGRLLQAYDKTGSHCVKADSPLWKRLIKFYVLPSDLNKEISR